MAYRGRALVELVTTLGEIPDTPVSDIDSNELLRVQVIKPQCSTTSVRGCCGRCKTCRHYTILSHRGVC